GKGIGLPDTPAAYVISHIAMWEERREPVVNVALAIHGHGDRRLRWLLYRWWWWPVVLGQLGEQRGQQLDQFLQRAASHAPNRFCTCARRSCRVRSKSLLSSAAASGAADAGGVALTSGARLPFTASCTTGVSADERSGQ